MAWMIRWEFDDISELWQKKWTHGILARWERTIFKCILDNISLALGQLLSQIGVSECGCVCVANTTVKLDIKGEYITLLCPEVSSLLQFKQCDQSTAAGSVNRPVSFSVTCFSTQVHCTPLAKWNSWENPYLAQSTTRTLTFSVVCSLTPWSAVVFLINLKLRGVFHQGLPCNVDSIVHRLGNANEACVCTETCYPCHSLPNLSDCGNFNRWQFCCFSPTIWLTSKMPLSDNIHEWLIVFSFQNKLSSISEAHTSQ